MLNHVTLILPIAYRGGSLRVTKSIAKMIRQGSLEAGEPCGVRIAILAGYYDLQNDFEDVSAYGVDVREYSWVDFTAENVQISAAHSNTHVETPYEKYCAPEDGVNNLTDTDLWVVISDRTPKPLAPLKPYAVFATDYIQRYVPEIIPKKDFGIADLPSLQTVRSAKAVITTTPQTREDVISYVGVPSGNVHLAPMDFDPTVLPDGQTERDAEEAPFFVWPTNPTAHKNHVRAYDALAQYYEKFGGTLKVRITGPNTLRMNPGHEVSEEIAEIPYIKKLRSIVEASATLQRNIDFVGELSDAGYAGTLREAEFLWHPTIIDNGTFAVAEAAWFGCPSLASGYPQMRYIGERFGIPMEFFNARSVSEMASSLKEMERKAAEMREKMPARNQLSQHTWETYAGEYWKMLKGVAA